MRVRVRVRLRVRVRMRVRVGEGEGDGLASFMSLHRRALQIKLCCYVLLCQREGVKSKW